MRTIICLLFALHCSLFAAAQPVANHLQAGQTPEGVVYFLPKTVFHFHVMVERMTYKPGEFARYAEKYLRMTDIRQNEETVHNVIRIDMTKTGIRDTSKCYAVRLKGGKSETAEITLSDDGVLLAVNDSPADGGTHVPFTAAQQPPPADPRRYLSAEVLAAGSTAKMAELTASQMQELQQRRHRLIMGDDDEELPQDERQLRLMITEIDREYNALLTLFTGSIHRDTTEHTLTVCPEQEIKQEVLFRLSKQLGLVDSDDLSGIPYYLTVEDPYKTTQEKYAVPINKKNEGFYVCVPGSIRLSLYREAAQIASFTTSAAQFGFVELRDGNLFRRYLTHLQLDPATGAVLRQRADTTK